MANNQEFWLVNKKTGERQVVASVDARGADPALYEIIPVEDPGPTPTVYPVVPEVRVNEAPPQATAPKPAAAERVGRARGER